MPPPAAAARHPARLPARRHARRHAHGLHATRPRPSVHCPPTRHSLGAIVGSYAQWRPLRLCGKAFGFDATGVVCAMYAPYEQGLPLLNISTQPPPASAALSAVGRGLASRLAWCEQVLDKHLADRGGGPRPRNRLL